MDKALLDTGVILDFFLDRQPFSDDAATLLTLCENKKIKGYLTPVIVSNIYCLLRKVSGHKKVIEKLKQLIAIIDILVIDKQAIISALNSSFYDFEDALKNYASELDGEIDVIITRNVKDFKNSTIGILTPDNYLRSLDVNGSFKTLTYVRPNW